MNRRMFRALALSFFAIAVSVFPQSAVAQEADGSNETAFSAEADRELDGSDEIDYPEEVEGWAEIESEHIHMLYPLRREGFARHALVYAEHAYRTLSAALDVKVGFRITIKVLDRVDQVLPLSESFQGDNIILTTWPPQDLLDGPYRGDWLERAVYHHVAHVLIENTRPKFSPLVDLLVYPLSFGNLFVPTWYLDGLSAWYETSDAPGRAVRDLVPAAVLRTDALRDDIPSLGAVLSERRSWLESRATAIYGTAFIQGAIQRFDADAFTRWNHENVKNLIPFTSGFTTERVFGCKWRDIYAQWRDERTREIKADETANAANKAANATDETTIAADGSKDEPTQEASGFRTGSWHHEQPHAVPHRHAVSYLHNDGLTERAIVMHDLDTHEETKFTECHGHCRHQWSVDGQTLFFTNVVRKTRHRIEKLYSLRMSDSLPHLVPMPGHVRSFTASPDAVYAVIEDGDAPRIYRTRLGDGAEPELVHLGNPYELIEDIVWLNGGRIIGVVSDADSREYDLYEFVDDGSRLHPRRLTTSLATEMFPYVAGEHLVGFVTEQDGIYYLHELDPDSGEERVIHAQRDGIYQPAQAQDGTIYYTTITADGTAILSIAPNRRRPPDTEPEPQKKYAPPISETYSREIEETKDLEAIPYRSWQAFIPAMAMPYFGYMIATGPYGGVDLYNADVLEHHHYNIHYGYFDRREAHEISLLYRWSEHKWWIETTGGLRQDTYTYDNKGDFEYFPFQVFWGKLQTGTEWHFPYLDVEFKIQYLFEYNLIEQNDRLDAMIDEYNAANTSLSHIFHDSAKAPATIEKGAYTRPAKTSALIAELSLKHLHDAYRTIPGKTGYQFDVLLRTETMFLFADYYTFINDVALTLSWPMPHLETHVFLIKLEAGFSYSESAFRNAFRVKSSTGFDFNEPMLLHGYHTGNIMGNNMWYVHTDYTFPVVEIRSGPEVFPLGVNRIGLGIYAEAANVWNEMDAGDFDIGDTRMSIGGEIYLDGTLGYIYGIRLKLGYGYGILKDGTHSYYIDFMFTP